MFFEELEVFRAVVKAGSFTRASEALGLTQAGVSRSVKSLEQRLGVAMFERRGRSLALTEAGRHVYDGAYPLLAQAVALREAASSLAAALAAGLCLGATGSDTAGSIRIPAHTCGTTGIMPTYGRVSRYGVVACAWSLDHCGPMARSVNDAALMLNAMAGFDQRDPASVDRPVPDFTAALNAGVRDLRVGVPRNYFTELVQTDVAEAYREAMRVLEALGAVAVEVELPSLGPALDVEFAIIYGEATAFHDGWLRERPQDYGDDVRLFLEVGKVVTAVDFLKAQRYRAVIQADLRSALERADVLITPTLPMTATPIGDLEVDINGSMVPLEPQQIRFTLPFNLSGFPAASVPCGFDRLGLPIGLQVAGRPWDESTVLRVSNAYQQATAWHTRRPPLAAAQPVA